MRPVNPVLRALWEILAFPSDEAGPVESWALARFAATCFSVADMGGNTFVSRIRGLVKGLQRGRPENIEFWLVTHFWRGQNYERFWPVTSASTSVSRVLGE